MPENPALTPEEFEEEWIVFVDREQFSLTGKQMSVIREAATAGNRGLVIFDRFAISIAHISCAYLARKTPKNLLEAPDESESGILPHEEALKKLDQIKNQLVKKLSMEEYGDN